MTLPYSATDSATIYLGIIMLSLFVLSGYHFYRKYPLSLRALRQTNHDSSLINALVEAQPFPALWVSPSNDILAINQLATTIIPHNLTVGHPLNQLFPTLNEACGEPSLRFASADPAAQGARKLNEVCYNGITYESYIFSTSQSKIKGYGLLLIQKTSLFDTQALQQNALRLSGLMTSGLCHDINTPLTAISNSLQIINKRLNDPTEKNIACAQSLGIDMNEIQAYCTQRDIFHFIKVANQAVAQTAALTTNALSLLKTSAAPSLINISQAIEECVSLARLTQKHPHITLHVLPNADHLIIRGVGAELKQALLNIIVNAAEAATANLNAIAPCVSVELKQQNDDAFLTITDNGEGIPDHMRHQLFSQCVTSKANDDGTGIGLPLSYYLVTERLHGSVILDNDYHDGCRFFIRLPCVPIKTKTNIEDLTT